jgi:methionyl-tRNA formyltransferase
MLEGKQIKIFEGRPLPNGNMQTGFETDGKTYLRFGCSDGWYEVTDVQLEGKKRMAIDEFLRGHRFKAHSL